MKISKLLFNRLQKLNDEDSRLKYLVDSCNENSDENIIDICEEFDRLRRIQTGLGMAQSLPTNSTYRGKIFEI